MSDGFARTVARIDEQLATLAALQHDTVTQLDSVATELARLEAHEMALIETLAGRERRIDLLLDERLLSVSEGKRETVRSR